MPDETDSLRLDQFLKLTGIADTGGRAKFIVQSGEVLVNGEVETRRRRKLTPGDIVEFEGNRFPVDDSFTGPRESPPPL